MSVDLPQPDGADRTMNSGFVFMKHDYTILGAPLPKQRLDFSVNSPVSTRHLSCPPASRGRKWNFTIPLSPRAGTHAGTRPSIRQIRFGIGDKLVDGC